MLYKTDSENESFVTLYGQYKEEMYQHAFSLTLCPDNSEDIVQDVFFNLWKQKDRWGEIDNIQAYLFRCTRNKTMDYFRRIKLERTKLQVWKEGQLFYDFPELRTETLETQRLHEAAVRQLPNRQRTIYTLRRFYDWERKKIARELGISEKTVKATMQVAIRSVKKFMEREITAQGVFSES